MTDFSPTSIPKATQIKNRQIGFKTRVAIKGTDESILNYHIQWKSTLMVQFHQKALQSTVSSGPLVFHLEALHDKHKTT